MENLYTEFTTKLLPQIQEGLTITKEYFADLFGRYIHYLIVIDSIYLAIALILLTVSIYLTVWGLKKTTKWVNAEDKPSHEDREMIYILFLFALLPIVSFTLMSLDYAENLVKDIYIPEVRIIEELNSYRVNNN